MSSDNYVVVRFNVERSKWGVHIFSGSVVYEDEEREFEGSGSGVVRDWNSAFEWHDHLSAAQAVADRVYSEYGWSTDFSTAPSVSTDEAVALFSAGSLVDASGFVSLTLEDGTQVFVGVVELLGGLR